MKNIIRVLSLRVKVVLFLLMICTNCYALEDGFDSNKKHSFFTVDNSKVNKLIIEAYEENREVWMEGQLYLVGVCYVAEEKINDAQKIFEYLTDSVPSNARTWRALGNVYQMKTETQKAIECYNRAWEIGHDVQSLTLMSALHINNNDYKIITPLLGDLISHQQEEIDIQKVLLAYSLMVENENEGKAVYSSVVNTLNKHQIEENKDLRTLLIKAMIRYKDIPTEVDSAEDGIKGEAQPNK